MAVNIVKLSDNVGRSLEYAGSPNKKPKVMSDDPKFLRAINDPDDIWSKHRRVLMADSINCSSNYKQATQQMMPVINKYHRRGKSQCVTCIISFNKLDYRNKKDWHTAMAINKKTMKMKFPNAQVASYLQADNSNHKLHVHNIICGYNAIDGKSNIANDNWQDIAHDLDAVEKEYHFTPVHNGLTKHSTGLNPQFNDGAKTTHNSHAVAHRLQTKKYSWINDIRQRISNACYNTPAKPNSIMKFRDNLRKNGVHAEMLSMKTDKKTGRRGIHFFKNPPKKRATHITYMNLKTHEKVSGWARLRKHWTYSFRPKGPHTKKYVIREKKLGTQFNNQNIIHNFGHHLMSLSSKNIYSSENNNTLTEVANNKLGTFNSQNEQNALQIQSEAASATISNHPAPAKSAASSKPTPMTNSEFSSETTASAKSLVSKVKSETPDNAEPQPVMQSTTSKASNEDDEDSVSSKSSSKPRVSPAPMPKFNVHIKTYATHNLNGYLSVPKKKAFLISPYNTHYIHYGEHYFKKYHHFFKYPIFTSPRLENLIQRDLRESDSEDKKISDLKNFESNCNKEDQDSINQRVEDESDYYAAKQAIRDAAVDIHNIEAAVERDKKLHHLQ